MNKLPVDRLMLIFVSTAQAMAKKHASSRYDEESMIKHLFGYHVKAKPIEVVNAREEIVELLVSHGASEPILGRWLNMDHSSINVIKKRLVARKLQESLAQEPIVL